VPRPGDGLRGKVRFVSSGVVANQMGLLGLNKAFLVRESDGPVVEIQETYVAEELRVEALPKSAITNKVLCVDLNWRQPSMFRKAMKGLRADERSRTCHWVRPANGFG